MEKINGVKIKELKKFTDDRGWLSEIYREDEDDFKPVMSYVSFTKKGTARGPHEHNEQSDYFVFTGPGDFELYLWDNRTESETYGNKTMIVVGESNPCKIIVPPSVVHGYKSITEPGSFCINLPDKLFMGKDKKEPIDENRYEDKPESGFVIE